jgi:hypothetical protein
MKEPNTTDEGLIRHGIRRVRRMRLVTAVCAATLVAAGGTVVGLQLAQGGATTHTPFAPAASGSVASPPPARSVDPEHFQLGPSHPEVGVRYPFDLTVHCGIRYAEFAGRSWKTAQDVKVPSPTPNPNTGVTTVTPVLPGYMTLVGADTARFEMAGLVPVTFHAMDRKAPLCA